MDNLTIRDKSYFDKQKVFELFDCIEELEDLIEEAEDVAYKDDDDYEFVTELSNELAFNGPDMLISLAEIERLENIADTGIGRHE